MTREILATKGATDGDRLLVESVVDRLTEMFPEGAALHEPSIGGNAWEYVKECLDTGWVSTAGKFVSRFEESLQDFTGATHAIATVNGTAALHTCLLLAGVQRDDEVIVPAMTFVATANAVSYCGAVPHFADIDRSTLSMCPERLEEHLSDIVDFSAGKCMNRKTGKRISAVICMHTLGHPADVPRLSEICERFGLPLVEDAAEALGSALDDRPVGSDAHLAAFSFNGNKILTTGGGGAVVTCNPELAEQAKHLTTTAKIPHAWAFDHDRVGFNYRMPNLNAALGCAQLEQMPMFLSAKRRLAEAYIDAFADLPEITVVRETPRAKSNYWLNAIILTPQHSAVREDILKKTNDVGIQTRPAWTPMHTLQMYKDAPRAELSVTEEIFETLIDLPSGVDVAETLTMERNR